VGGAGGRGGGGWGGGGGGREDVIDLLHCCIITVLYLTSIVQYRIFVTYCSCNCYFLMIIIIHLVWDNEKNVRLDENNIFLFLK